MQQPLITKPRLPLKLWTAYQKYVEKVMEPPSLGKQLPPDHLSNRLFTQAILYGIPAGTLALIPTIYVALSNGQFFLAAFGIGILFAVACISLSSGLSMSFRKLAASAALIITCMVLTALRGLFSIGCVYLLTCSVFYALHFSNKFARRAVWVNVAVCALFTIAITFKLLRTDAMATISLSQWIANSVNFLFLNIVIVVMIRQTIARLEQTMKKEAEINQRLKSEFWKKQVLHESLRESELRYKTLFSLSPSANLIFDTDTLHFLETNQAATDIYGYSQDEFMDIKLTDIHLEADLPTLLQHLTGETRTDGISLSIRSQHVRKDGTLIHVELLKSNVELKGKPARMIVVSDITVQVEQLNAIQKQNAKLREIAYIQSHLVRLPLTRIMALTELITDEFGTCGDPELLTALSRSSNELDEFIRRVVDESSAILDELGSE